MNEETPTGIVGVTRDITERKALEQLRASEARFRAIYDAMPLCLALWQQNGDDFILSDVNAASIALSNSRIQNYLGTSLSAFYEDTPWIIDVIETSYREQKLVEAEHLYRMRGRLSQELFLHFHFAPLPLDMDICIIAG